MFGIASQWGVANGRLDLAVLRVRMLCQRHLGGLHVGLLLLSQTGGFSLIAELPLESPDAPVVVPNGSGELASMKVAPVLGGAATRA